MLQDVKQVGKEGLQHLRSLRLCSLPGQYAAGTVKERIARVAVLWLAEQVVHGSLQQPTAIVNGKE